MLGTVLLIILVLLLIGALPGWRYASWGWGPPGGLGFVLLIVLILVLMGRL